jgi:DNA-binding MarR family transcriptional regulator
MKIGYTAAEDHGITTLRELRVLYLVHRGLCDEVRDLAYRMAVAKPCITRALSALEAKGYGQRTPHESDKRCMHFILTESGKAAATEIFT